MATFSLVLWIFSCAIFKTRWSDCKSIGNWFHSHYVYGRSPNCEEMKLDYEICKIWERTGSLEAKQQLLDKEKKRLKEKNKYTPVWELRTSPPENWNVPLDQK
ncbi:synaptic plasticity regulator PANTS-like isoform X2 [Glandiceps talaboti]